MRSNQHRIRHCLAATAMTVGLAACGGGGSTSSGPGPSSPPGGGGGGGSPPPPPPIQKTELESTEEAARFLMQAGFGGSAADVADLEGIDAAQWVQAEFNKPATLYLPTLRQRAAGGDELKGRPHSYLFWDAMISGDDQLRQRMVFALSQIIVVSDANMGNSLETAYFMDVLSRNAFGNYRDLLQEVTYTPAMAEYLTYLRNRKGNEKTGRMPDENYARELMQLFTIGLVELNMDGTLKTDASGNPIETYDNQDVVGLARVFTGLSGKGTLFYKPDEDFRHHPLQMYQEQHSERDKPFLTTTIPASTLGDDAITLALDEIFAHPNVAPFVSRQLIQRFTSSHPSGDYVERVATAFESGAFTAPNGARFGTGERGDLQATLAAILLDESVHRLPEEMTVADGKVREPVLKFVHWARAFDVSRANTEEEGRLRDTRSPSRALSQHPFRSPSVFNFYRPGFVAPGTQTGAANLNAPELQIVNESSSVGYVNFLTDFIFVRRNGKDGERHFVPDYTDEIALAEDPEALTNHLDELLTGGRMSEATKTDIQNVISAIEVTEKDAENDRLKRVYVAVLLTTESSAYAVIE